MSTDRIKKVLGIVYAVLFTLALIAALAVSTWSLMHLSVTFFEVPQTLGWVVSGVFDIGAFGAAVLATINALDGESGGKAKFVSLLLIAVSAFLNAQHAIMLGHGLVAACLYAVPSIGAAFLLELFLDWVKAGAMRAKGRVHKEFPLIRNLATVASTPRQWIAFYRKGLAIDLEVAKRQMETRLKVTTGTTESMTVTIDRDDSSHDMKAIDAVPEVIEAKRHDKTTDDTTQVVAPKRQATEKHDTTSDKEDDTTELDDIFSELGDTTRLSELVTVALDKGLSDRDELQKAAERHLGIEVKRSTLNTCIQRYNKKNAQVGMYL